MFFLIDCVRSSESSLSSKINILTHSKLTINYYSIYGRLVHEWNTRDKNYYFKIVNYNQVLSSSWVVAISI